MARSDSQSEPDESGSLGRGEASRLLAAYLVREVELGLEFVPLPSSLSPSPPPAVAAGLHPNEGVERPQVADLSDLLIEPGIRDAADLDGLRAVLGDCRRCKLCDERNNIVFGVGSSTAELIFVGEGPGEDEDKQGIPFVGRAGSLLTDIITKGMGLRRGDVYIANVVKCRPPGNRNPEPDEIVACEPFLHRQIALIRPRVIVTLGTFATQCLLKNRIPISKQRGKWSEYQGVPLLPTFHPAYVLRNPADKRLVWEDIKMVMERIGIAAPRAR